MAEQHIAYSHLGILQDPNYVNFDGKLWSYNESNIVNLYKTISKYGAEWQRILPWGVWEKHSYGIKSQFSPYVLSGEKFDLRFTNDHYFTTVKKIIRIARDFGIKTWFCLMDNCQFHGACSKWSPWVTNVNGISNLYSKNAYPFLKTFINQCLFELKGLNVGWSWGNEMNNMAFPNLAKVVLFPFIKKGYFVPSNCTYGATLQDTEYINKAYADNKPSVQDYVKKDVGVACGDKVKLAIWREVHGVGEEPFPILPNILDQSLSWWGNHPIKIWLSDDGCFNGKSNCDKFIYKGKTQIRPSAAQWMRIISIAREYKNSFVFEHLPKAADDLKCQAHTIRCMYMSLYGKTP